MKRLLSTALMISALCLPVISTAADLSGQSRTYLLYRETLDNTKRMPLYEYLDFKADNVATENITLHFGGWLRYDLKSGPSGTRSDNYLQFGYLSYRAARSNMIVDLGRYFVNEGAAAALIDGLHARTDLQGGLQAAVFAGIPVEQDLNGRKGDSVYGGRLGHSTDYTRIGVSFIREKDNNAEIRKEEILDLWLRPISAAELSGTSSFNALTKEWMQHTYHLTLGPFSKLTLGTDASRIIYKDYFRATTMSAFKLTSGPTTTIIDPNERISSIGETVSYAIGPTTLSFNYTAYTYAIAGNATNYGAQLAFAAARGGAGLGTHRMNGDKDIYRYTDYRVYAYTRAGNADMTVDFLTVSYDVPINSVKNAYAAILAGGYNLTKRVKVIADVEYNHNPFYDRDVRGMLQFVYAFDTAAGPQGGK
jgi:hypothetical protein